MRLFLGAETRPRLETAIVRRMSASCPLTEHLEPRLMLSAVDLLPAPAAPDLLAAYDTGLFNWDNITAADNSSAAEVLGFEVSGLTAGAQVVLYCDGTPIGEAVADASGTAMVLTDGATALATGTYEITAIQQADIGGEQRVSEPSEPLTIRISVGLAATGVITVITNGSWTTVQTMSCNSDSGWTWGILGLCPRGYVADGVIDLSPTTLPDGAVSVILDDTPNLSGFVDPSDAAPSSGSDPALEQVRVRPLTRPESTRIVETGKSERPALLSKPSEVFQLTLPAAAYMGGESAHRTTEQTGADLIGGYSRRSTIAEYSSHAWAPPADGGPIDVDRAANAAPQMKLSGESTSAVSAESAEAVVPRVDETPPAAEIAIPPASLQAHRDRDEGTSGAREAVTAMMFLHGVRRDGPAAEPKRRR